MIFAFRFVGDSLDFRDSVKMPAKLKSRSQVELVAGAERICFATTANPWKLFLLADQNSYGSSTPTEGARQMYLSNRLNRD